MATTRGGTGRALAWGAGIRPKGPAASAAIRETYNTMRNIQLQRSHTHKDLTAIHVIKRSIYLQLWIMVSGGWY